MPKNVPFSNSMDDGNEPGGESPNPGANDDRPDNFGDRKATKSDGDAGSTTFRTLQPPKDPHAPPGDMNPGSSAEASDYGISDDEVGYGGSVAQYGLTDK